MADRFYQANVGAGMPPSVTEAGATNPAATFEFRVTYDATQNSKLMTLRALEAIAQAVTTDTWPPV